MLRYPIYFEDRICPHCASTGISFLDKNGNNVKNPIYPVEYMVCMKCRRKFFIRWIDKGTEKIPVPCSKATISDFEANIIDYIHNKRKE